MKVLMLGASGAVGRLVLCHLASRQEVSEITVLVRSKIPLEKYFNVWKQTQNGVKHSSYSAEEMVKKINVKQVNFQNAQEWRPFALGDIFISCLGTTLRDAGSRQKFKEIDHDLVFQVAKEGKNHGIHTCAMISSFGVGDPFMELFPSFYIDTKSSLEQHILELHFNRSIFIRPSFLAGKRDQKRFLEGNAISTLGFVERALSEIGILRRLPKKVQQFFPVQINKVAETLVNETLGRGNKSTEKKDRDENEVEIEVFIRNMNID